MLEQHYRRFGNKLKVFQINIFFYYIGIRVKIFFELYKHYDIIQELLVGDSGCKFLNVMNIYAKIRI